MMRKGAMLKVQPSPDQFLSLIFVNLKKDARHRSESKRFHWKGQLLQLLCLCFDLGATPKIFTKFLNIILALLRKLMVQLIMFLDNILNISASIEELILTRDNLIYLLQGLGFVVNIKSQF